jgi:Helix-turn-helix
MQATEDQITALGFYRDIIVQNVPKIADGIGVSPQTLQGWTEGEGEPTGEEAQQILDFLKEKFGAGPPDRRQKSGKVETEDSLG